MAGRGRGRGRGMSINIEALGLGKGENLPPIAVPPPLFPPLSFKPVPLTQSDEMNYMLALKQELTESFRKSPFYIKPQNRSKDIHRYSDKYQLAIVDSQAVLTYDSSRLPAELQDKPKRKRLKTAARPNLKSARCAEDVSSLLEKLEQKDNEQDKFEDAEDDDEKKEKVGKDEEDETEELEEEYDEGELEEDNDYNMAYFDNGEDYEDNDNDDEEGPTY